MDEIKMEGKIGGWIQQGFELFKDNAVTLIVATALVMVIGGATCGILIGPMFAGLLLITLALADKREPKPDLGMVFKGFDYFMNTFLFWLVWSILVFLVAGVLGFFVCVGHLLAAALVLALKTLLMFALFLIVERKMDFWPASLASIDRVKQNFFPLLAFVVIIAVIALAGCLACGIGVIVTAPIAVCCLTVAYRDVFGPPPADA